nr:uncharacterized protein LOC118972347 isoform X2 [Manis javanica]
MYLITLTVILFFSLSGLGMPSSNSCCLLRMPGDPCRFSCWPSVDIAIAVFALGHCGSWRHINCEVCCVISWKKPLFCRLSRRLLLKGIHNQRRDMETHRRKRQLCEDGGRG